MTPSKSLLAVAACGLALAGCATGPYYDRYAYETTTTYSEPRQYTSEERPVYRYEERPVYRYAEPPVVRYYDPYPGYYYPGYYVAPSIGLSFGFSGRFGHRH